MWEPGKPSKNENEFFALRDQEWLKARRLKLDAERRAKHLSHSLTCPRCDAKLHERLFHDVRVDVCSVCRGVWLDAGELHMLAHVNDNDLLRVVHEIDTKTQ